MQARFVRLDWENATRTIGTVYFKPDKPFYFTAGQYTDLTVPHDNPDNRGLTRTMTISSSPDDAFIAITTRFDGRLSTYKRALLDLQPNAAVSLSDAMGDMVLPLDATVPLVFVAGGVGIASYISIARWLRARDDMRQMRLLYAVRDIRDIIFQDVFDDDQFEGHLTKHLFTTDNKTASTVWNGSIKKSRLTAADIVSAMPPESQIYLSGAQSMVESLRAELETTHNVPQYRIAFDYFDGYSET